MPIRLSSLLPLLLAGTALAACGGDRTPVPEAPTQLDPAIVAALADPLMIDPDLASQNGGNAAIALDTFGAVPLDDASPEAIAAAKADAARLAGGMIKTAPDAAESGPTPAPALTAGQLAAALPALPAGCIDSLRYGYAWAASMPPALPIYPRGHVQEAAGSTACGVRAIVFTTPVEASAVIDFYFTRAGAAGFSAERRSQGEVDALSGRRGAAAFVVRVRSGANGLSQVELATRN
ncbi:MAG: hypothetical protein JWQ16_1017 [Novosphingobium sp.]|nr:hypothetical protein [Novosphingobium sp.]